MQALSCAANGWWKSSCYRWRVHVMFQMTNQDYEINSSQQLKWTDDTDSQGLTDKPFLSICRDMGQSKNKEETEH